MFTMVRQTNYKKLKVISAIVHVLVPAWSVDTPNLILFYFLGILKVDRNDVLAALGSVGSELFGVEGILRCYFDPIWSRLSNNSNNLDGNVSAKSLYISVYQNRHSWQSKLREKFEIGQQNEESLS